MSGPEEAEVPVPGGIGVQQGEGHLCSAGGAGDGKHTNTHVQSSHRHVDVTLFQLGPPVRADLMKNCDTSGQQKKEEHKQ